MEAEKEAELKTQPVPRAHGGPLKRILLTVGYDGTKFCGWQKQCPPDEAPLRTSQGVLEETLRLFYGDPKIRLTGASRTDSGVHAIGQRAFFETHTPMPYERMAHAISGRLPDDMVVYKAEPAPIGFDVIGGVESKQYRYRILSGFHKPLLTRHHVHHVFAELDTQAMQQAAQKFVGTHDIAAFAAVGHGRQTTVRTIFDCHIEIPENLPGEVHVVISGSGFLYNTVRIIAGTLLEVGRGSRQPEQITAALESKQRRDAGSTLPPQGLCLEWVKYRPGGKCLSKALETGYVPPVL